MPCARSNERERRVSSARISCASRRVRNARSEMSSRLPIGVATSESKPAPSDGRRSAKLDRLAEFGLEISAQAILQALLELSNAFTRDAEAVADLLQRHGLVGHQALVEDRC